MRAKTLVVMGAMLCLLAVSSSAYAADYFPTGEPGPEHAFQVKASGGSTLTVGEVSIKCKEAVFTGITPPKTGSSTQKIDPTFKGCSFDGEPVNVTNEHCTIEYYDQILISPGVYAEFTGFVENGGTCHMRFQIIAFGETCEVIVQSQNELKGSEQTDLKPGLEVNSALVGIAYKVTSACEKFGLKGGTNGKYSGTAKTEALFIE
jgi:hypothetical protein